MKNLTHILLLVLLTACTGKTQPMKTKAKDNPEVRNMLEVYSKQKHRIAFKGCEMLYNDKPFKLGMTIKELESIFGEYDLFNRGHYVWKEAGIVFVTESDEESINNKPEAIYIYMNTTVSENYKESLKQRLFHKKGYFLFQGMPIDKKIQFKDFIKNSHFELNDFAITNSSYDLTLDCGNKNMLFMLGSIGATWIYKGGGHIMLKDHPNEDNKYPIEEFYIRMLKKEEN